MPQTAINLYSVRELDEGMINVFDRVADAGYDGVQLSGGTGDATPEEAANKLDERGLGVTPAHIGIEALEEGLQATVTEYRDTLGVDGAVVPYLGEEQFESREAVDKTAARLADLADDLAEYGWDLHYHNHAHEFTDLDGENGFERFVRHASEEVLLELDVGWALVAGSDPVELIETHGDRIDLLHMKDMDLNAEPGFCEIGEGDVDMAACAEAGRAAGVDWLIYEHDKPEDPVASIDTGGAFLEEL